MQTIIALAALLLLAMPAVAEPIQITGTDVLEVMWHPAAGPVTGYMAKLTYADGTEGEAQFIETNFAVFRPRRGAPFKVLTRACQKADTGLDVCDGPWSPGSDVWVMCPRASDIDCDLVTGVDDFIILSHEWGRVSEPTVEDGDE